MTRAPIMPLFVGDYMADTRHLTLEQHGAYFSLLMIAWNCDGCRLPDDDKQIAQMLGIPVKRWDKLKPRVMAFWVLHDGHWTQKRLSKERQYVAEKSEKNAQAAQARWNTNPLKNKAAPHANAMQTLSERYAPKPIPIKKQRADGRLGLPDGPRPPLENKPALSAADLARLAEDPKSFWADYEATHPEQATAATEPDAGAVADRGPAIHRADHGGS